MSPFTWVAKVTAPLRRDDRIFPPYSQELLHDPIPLETMRRVYDLPDLISKRLEAQFPQTSAYYAESFYPHRRTPVNRFILCTLERAKWVQQRLDRLGYSRGLREDPLRNPFSWVVWGDETRRSYSVGAFSCGLVLRLYASEAEEVAEIRLIAEVARVTSQGE